MSDRKRSGTAPGKQKGHAKNRTLRQAEETAFSPAAEPKPARKNGKKPEKTAPSPRLTGKKVVWKGGTLLSPLPCVIVTCRDGDTVDAVTVGWTGILCSQPPMTYISLRPERFSHDMVEKTGEFVINVMPAASVRQVDLCGVKSGRDCDKIALCDFHLLPGSAVSVPILREAILSLECRVTQKQALGSHDLFMAEIAAVRADEGILDGDGKLCPEKAGLLAYSHGTYHALGKQIGTFGFSVRKKRTGTRKDPRKKDKKKTKEGTEQ